MTAESSAEAIEQASAGDMMQMGWSLMRQLTPSAMLMQQKPGVAQSSMRDAQGNVIIGGKPTASEERIELLSLHVAQLTSCLNMLMIAMAKEAEIKSLPRAQRRRRMN